MSETASRSVSGAARDRLGEAKHNIKVEATNQLAAAAAADGAVDHLRGQVDEARAVSRQPSNTGRLGRAGQNVDLVGLAIALVVVGVVMYVGLNVMSTTEQSTEVESNSEFANASADLTNGISDAYSLSGILFLVLILTGVVGLLLGLRARR